MNWASLKAMLTQYAPQLITLGGTINPYVGGTVAVIIAGLLIWFGIKAGAQAWINQQNNAGQANAGAAGDQGVVTNVLNGLANWIVSGGKNTNVTPPPAPPPAPPTPPV